MSFMELFIVSTLLILRVVSFMVISQTVTIPLLLLSLDYRLLPFLVPYVNAVLLFLIIIEMKS